LAFLVLNDLKRNPDFTKLTGVEFELSGYDNDALHDETGNWIFPEIFVDDDEDLDKLRINGRREREEM